MRKFLISIISLYFVFLGIVGQMGCGQIGAPMGGPKDSLPPLLMKTTPTNEQLQFNQNKIVLEFDEYIQLDNPFQNVIVSPIPKKQPTIEHRLKTVTVKWRDTLEENTTYIIDFGKSIKDVNEGNIAKNLKYVFSTGSYLDSLTLSGKVILAETGKVDSTLVVVLHPSDEDSAVIKQIPRYFTTLDKEGKFKFEYLPPAEYSIYALKDEGGQRKYLSPTQLFGFYSERINTTNPSDSIIIYAYLEEEEKEGEEGGGNDIFSNISSQKKSDKKVELKDYLVLANNLSGGKQDILDSLVIQSVQAPFKTFDTTKILLYGSDSSLVKDVRYTWDTTMKQIKLSSNWIPDKSYYLIMDSTWAVDTLNHRPRKIDTVSFYTKKESEYGLVRLRFKKIDLEKHPILQFLSNNKVVYEKALTTAEFYAKLFKPGEYEIRIVYDENQNGKWDAGKFFKEKRQPERVIPIDTKINVRANWESEVDIEL